MNRRFLLGYLAIALLLVLGWMSLNGDTSKAASPEGFTNTPTSTTVPTDTSMPPDTPTPTGTLVRPTITSLPTIPPDTPSVPPDTPVPGPQETPAGIETPGTQTPVGTIVFPVTGQAAPTTWRLLLLVAVGLLILGIRMSWRSVRLF